MKEKTTVQAENYERWKAMVDFHKQEYRLLKDVELNEKWLRDIYDRNYSPIEACNILTTAT